MPKPNITILKPTWKSAVTAKTFELVEGTNTPKLVSSYDLGKSFSYATTTVTSIPELYKLLDRCKDKPVIRIYGTPVPGLDKLVRRKKENFECPSTNLLLLDADGWPVPPDHDIGSKEGLFSFVQAVLEHLQLTALVGVQFCCLLSSSSWKTDQLRAHLYFMIDDYVLLQDLHTWGFNHNTLNAEYKIDYSLFRQVQPDFISKRMCRGFKDPLSDQLRLTAHCENLSPYVEKAHLTKHFNKAQQQSSDDPYSEVNQAVKQVPIGASWEKTLELCGSKEHGINEPAYRACAQLVQEIGDSAATTDIIHYVSQVHTKMWAAINRHGLRGSKEDRELYTREKIKGYIQTAVKKKFGEESDLKVRAVTDAISAIQAGGSPSILFSRDCLESMKYMKLSMPSRWIDVRGAIKQRLRGKVAIADLDKAIKSNDDTLDTELVVEGIIEQFKWIYGENDRCMYCLIEKSGRYELKPVDDGVIEHLKLAAFAAYSGKPPHMLETTILQLVMSRLGDSMHDPFIVAPVEARCYTEIKNGESKTYYNVGTGHDGSMKTVVISGSSVTVVPSVAAPVYWRSSTNLLVAEVDEFEDTIELLGDVGKEFYIDKYLDGMRKFTSVDDDEDLIEVVAWQVVAAANTGTANLLQITGASGDGKSSSATFTKDLIDPTSASLREGPDLHSGLYRKEDMAKTLRKRHVTVFDNLSKIHPRDQDMLCSVATGWRYDMRVMYTQRYLDLVIKKPIILTALVPVVTNQDLRSRTMSVMVSADRKTATTDIYADWEMDAPAMRVGFFFFLSRVLDRVNKRRKLGKKMNDRDLWGVSARVEAGKRLGTINEVGKTDDELAALVTKRKRFENMNEAMLNSNIVCLIAWMIRDPIFRASEGVVQLNPQQCYQSINRFVNECAGQVIDINGFPVTVSPRDAPDTARAFTTRMGIHQKDITEVTGWKVSKRRVASQRLWVFVRQGG